MKYITLFILIFAGCGNGGQTKIDRITCAQMKSLADRDLLPAAQSDKDAVRADLAQAVANEEGLGTVGTLGICNY